jgi:hypothetical protein
MILVKTLIILLVILILLYLYKRLRSFFGVRTREGLENIIADKAKPSVDKAKPSVDTKKIYTDPELNDNPLYLATLNGANISYLKEQVDELSGLKQKVATLETQVELNKKGIIALGEQFSVASQELTGRDPDSTEPLPTVTGIQ